MGGQRSSLFSSTLWLTLPSTITTCLHCLPRLPACLLFLPQGGLQDFSFSHARHCRCAAYSGMTCLPAPLPCETYSAAAAVITRVAWRHGAKLARFWADDCRPSFIKRCSEFRLVPCALLLLFCLCLPVASFLFLLFWDGDVRRRQMPAAACGPISPASGCGGGGGMDWVRLSRLDARETHGAVGDCLTASRCLLLNNAAATGRRAPLPHMPRCSFLRSFLLGERRPLGFYAFLKHFCGLGCGRRQASALGVLAFFWLALRWRCARCLAALYMRLPSPSGRACYLTSLTATNKYRSDVPCGLATCLLLDACAFICWRCARTRTIRLANSEHFHGAGVCHYCHSLWDGLSGHTHCSEAGCTVPLAGLRAVEVPSPVPA